MPINHLSLFQENKNNRKWKCTFLWKWMWNYYTCIFHVHKSGAYMEWFKPIYIHYAKHIRFGETPLKNKNHVINIILYAKNIFSTIWKVVKYRIYMQIGHLKMYYGVEKIISEKNSTVNNFDVLWSQWKYIWGIICLLESDVFVSVFLFYILFF